jgi:hypothetical protein
MPQAFDEERAKPGRRVQTVTKGPNKGRLLVLGGPHPVLGGLRGGRHRPARSSRPPSRAKRRKRRKRSAKDFEGYL